jgi:uncharacterized protein YdbL (DUF1318 family)
METSMKNLLRNIAAAGVLAGMAAAPISASAASAMIEQAKSQCIVGEQADGYIGFVPGADIPDDLRREVRDTNQARKAFYADLSKRNGVTIEVAAALTAEKLMQQAGPGECIRMQDGSWVEV